ncbi:MAG: tetratricopeptide repeat protein [Bacteroidetes bacterium]|nr:MAG: tetratricopeptide repeat protein [Bacteroidota bacterium]
MGKNLWLLVSLWTLGTFAQSGQYQLQFKRAEQFFQQEKYEQAEKSALKALEILPASHRARDKHQQILRLLYQIKSESGDQSGALDYISRLFSMYPKKDTSHLRIMTAMDLAREFRHFGQPDSSIFYLTKALGLAEKHHVENKVLIGTIHYHIGSNHIAIGEFKLAKKHLLKAKSIIDPEKNPLEVSKILSNLGDLYSNSGKPEKALDCFKRGLVLIPADKAESYEIALSNIGASYIKLNQLDSAIRYVNDALILSRQINDHLGELICLNNLATIYRDQGRMNRSLDYYLKALQMVEKTESPEQKTKILLNVSEVYEQLNNSDSALAYYIRYTEMKDQLFNEEKAKFILETEEKYQTSQRKQEIAELKVKKQQDETEKLAMRYSMIIGLIIFLFILVIVYVIYRTNVHKLKSEKEFAIISAALDSEEKERQRISQEIHDDLGGILGMSRMLFSRTKRIILPENPELYGRIDKLLVQANSRSRAISHELFSPTLKQFGLIKALKELFDNANAAKPEIQFNFECSDPEIQLNEVLSTNLYRIAQELLNNSMKYASATEIELRLERTNKELQLIYRDNGVGTDLSSTPQGVGLKSIQSRVNRIKGSIVFNTAPGEGFESILSFAA